MSVYTGARLTRAQVLGRRTQVVELTGAGLTDDEIAVELGYANRSGVWKARQRALEARVADSVDELRTLELMRLDALQTSLWEAAMSGKVAAIREVRRIIEARCRLLGLVSGKPERNPHGPESVVLPSFWEHMAAHHPQGWLTCRCPGFMGDVPESENGWLRGS